MMGSDKAFETYMGEMGDVMARESETARRRAADFEARARDARIASAMSCSQERTVARTGLASRAVSALSAGRRLVRG